MRISDWSSDVCSSDLPQMYGGADGSQLAHGAIPAPLGFVTERNSLRRKYEWDGTGRHKMLDAYGAGHGATQGAAPGLDGAVRLVEREMLAAGIDQKSTRLNSSH